MFFVHGRLVRTPAEWVAIEADLKNIELKIRQDGISDYSIEPFDPTKEKKKPITPVVTKEASKPKKTTKKSKKEKATTTLGKLLEDE